MATPRTEITEIVSGLGMLGFSSLEHALTVRPALVHNVGPAQFARLEAAFAAGEHRTEFAVAWANGEVFARSADHRRRAWAVDIREAAPLLAADNDEAVDTGTCWG